MVKIARKDLNALAKDINKVIGVDPALDFGKKIKDADLQAEIVGCLDMIEKADEKSFTPGAWSTLAALGCANAQPDEKKPARSRGAKKDTAKKDTAAPASPKKAPKKPRYTRANAFADAVKSGVKDLDKLADKANTLYVKNGGKDNLKESKWMQGHSVGVLVAMGFATVEDNKLTVTAS